MRILWFPRLQFDTDRMHITTWREMCREMRAAGHDVRIAVAGKNPNGDFKGFLVPITIVPVKFLRIISFWVNGFLQFILTAGRFRPDAVIFDVFTCWFSLPLLLIPRRFRPVMILDNRTPVYIEEIFKGPRTVFMRNYTRLCFTYCRLFLDGMTVITGHYRELVVKRYSFEPGRVAVWGSGVNTALFASSRFASADRPAQLRGKFVVMQHGEISPARGLFQTIEALNIIGGDDIRLFLVGDVVRGDQSRREMFAEIKAADKGNRVVIFPPVSNLKVPELINHCDCAVMPYPNIEYWNNNNPIKLAEYLSMGKPVICTDMWTFRSVMGESSCAVYVREDSPQLIAEAILHCYRNRDRLTEWGAEGRQVAEKGYSWAWQASVLTGFIGKLARARGPRRAG